MDNREMFESLGIAAEIYDFCETELRTLKDRFQEIDDIAEYNQLKVIKAMQDAQVTEAHL